jgi:hypothetical protein
MTTVAKARLESLAHLAVVAGLALSVLSNAILFFGGARRFSSEDAGIFLLLSIDSWLALAAMAVILNIAGSEHHRFAFWAMFLALLGIFFSGFAFPVVT